IGRCEVDESRLQACDAGARADGLIVETASACCPVVRRPLRQDGGDERRSRAGYVIRPCRAWLKAKRDYRDPRISQQVHLQSPATNRSYRRGSAHCVTIQGCCGGHVAGPPVPRMDQCVATPASGGPASSSATSFRPSPNDRSTSALTLPRNTAWPSGVTAMTRYGNSKPRSFRRWRKSASASLNICSMMAAASPTLHAGAELPGPAAAIACGFENPRWWRANCRPHSASLLQAIIRM